MPHLLRSRSSPTGGLAKCVAVVDERQAHMWKRIDAGVTRVDRHVYKSTTAMFRLDLADSPDQQRALYVFADPRHCGRVRLFEQVE
jgi:hypothetical protein